MLGFDTISDEPISDGPNGINDPIPFYFALLCWITQQPVDVLAEMSQDPISLTGSFI